MRNFLQTRQGAGAGSALIALSFFTSGVLTYVFFGLSARVLGRGPEFDNLAVLWSATFLTVQVLWIGVSQTLGRYIAEKEARGEDPRPVISSVKRLQVALLAVFVSVALLASPLLAGALFGGALWLATAFVVAVAAYAPEYFRRGTFGGRRQFARLGALHVAESSSRVLVAGVLLLSGAGVAGPAAAIVLAPIVGVLLVRPTSEALPENASEPFSATKAFRFTGPILACVAFAQALMNGGPILTKILGGAQGQTSVLLLALVLARAPQYFLSPVIAGLLPHASRILATEGAGGLDRFVARAAGAVGFIGIAMIAGTWLLGEWAMRLLYGPEFDASRKVLVALAMLAAFYLMSETLNQALFARGDARLAALGWALGPPVSAVALAVLRTGVLERVSYALALGALAAAIAQAAFYLATRRRGEPLTGS